MVCSNISIISLDINISLEKDEMTIETELSNRYALIIEQFSH